MDMPDDSGSTRRDSLMQILNTAPEDSEMYDSALAQLEDAPEIPFYLEHIWGWFWQIHRGRTYGMSGPNPLTWPDIQSWTNLLQTTIRPIEVEILKEIDNVYLEYVAKKQKKKGKK